MNYVEKDLDESVQYIISRLRRSYKFSWNEKRECLKEVITPEEVDPELKKQISDWVTLLHSGNFNQTTSALVSKGHYKKYCCLGVGSYLCGISYEEMKDWAVPSSVKASATSHEKLWDFLTEGFSGIPDFIMLLANMNDSNFTFEEIAELLEFKFKLHN